MRTIGGLFARLVNPAHLDRAAKLTVRGKRRRSDVAWFLFRREEELARLGGELAEGTYRPERPERLIIRDPKPRLISRIPIADRVVHTALVLLIEPVFLASLTADAYACRPGFGTHRAVLRLLELCRKHRYLLHLDIRSYFASIDVQILRGLLSRRIRDERFLAVLDRGLEMGSGLYDEPVWRSAAGLDGDWPLPGRGVPIGALTSQLFAAHVYLAGFDHFVKRVLKVPGYVRYVDDLFLFGDQRCGLERWRRQAVGWLDEQRHLRLKHPEARVLSCFGSFDALGYRIRQDGATVLPRALRRFRRRMARELDRPPWRRSDVEVERSVASTAGVVLFGP